VELRRALLLFAIVLGLAAVVSSLANPRTREDRAADEPARTTPEANPSSSTATAQPAAGQTAVIRFAVGKPRKTETVRAETAATVEASVEEPGEVRIDGLGLIAQATPLTPARFDVLSTRPGRYPVRFRAVPDSESRLLGFLQVVPAPAP